MNISPLIVQLHHFGLKVHDVKEIDYGTQVKLQCGPILNIYHSGKILAQGKVSASDAAEVFNKLKQILPASTRWQTKIEQPNRRLSSAYFALNALQEGAMNRKLSDHR